MVINLFSAIIIGIVGFMTARLYKAVDNLYKRTEDLKVDMEKRPTNDQIRVRVEDIAETRLLLHEKEMH